MVQAQSTPLSSSNGHPQDRSYSASVIYFQWELVLLYACGWNFLPIFPQYFSIIIRVFIIQIQGQLMERKGMRTTTAEEQSFRSNRTSNYNINDYLPPAVEAMSRVSVFGSRMRDKIYTEPNERSSALEVAEIKRKLERAEEENGNLSKEVEKMARLAETREKLIAEKDELLKEKEEAIKQLTVRLSDCQAKLATEVQRPALSHTHSNIHFIYYPKLHQKYEVSVQTDSIDLAFALPAQPKKTGKATDRQMSEIQEKLSRLNMKKTVKEKPSKPPAFQLTKPDRFQRGQTIFSKIQDKENLIRLSNTFDRVSNPERVRQQTLQIPAIQLDQAERMIRLYMQ